MRVRACHATEIRLTLLDQRHGGPTAAECPEGIVCCAGLVLELRDLHRIVEPGLEVEICAKSGFEVKGE